MSAEYSSSSSQRPQSRPPSPQLNIANNSNATPGPSTIKQEIPSLFLPPPGPPPQPIYLASTQDLLAKFRLVPAYDKYVRTAYTGSSDGLGDHSAEHAVPTDKGKGKERESATSPRAPTPAADLDPDHDQDGDDDDGAHNGKSGEKKKRNNYKHLIKGLPGKHSLKKDDYLTSMMLVPPKQRIPITPFDARTQKDAFTVSLEGLKGWNTGALILESAQVREDRKKRKELRKLAKAQAQMPNAAASTSTLTVPAPTVASLVSRQTNGRPSGNSTPRPGTSSGTPRPSAAMPTPRLLTNVSRPTLPPVHVPAPLTARVASPMSAARVATPISATIQNTPALRTATPTSAAGFAAQQQHHQHQSQHHPHQPQLQQFQHPPPHSAPPPPVRGKKREREESSNGVNGFANGTPVHYQAPIPTPTVVGARAGVAGVRPRPLKKQRVDVQGQGRDATGGPVQQQPTPQGV